MNGHWNRGRARFPDLELDFFSRRKDVRKFYFSAKLIFFREQMLAWPAVIGRDVEIVQISRAEKSTLKSRAQLYVYLRASYPAVYDYLDGNNKPINGRLWPDHKSNCTLDERGKNQLNDQAEKLKGGFEGQLSTNLGFGGEFASVRKCQKGRRPRFGHFHLSFHFSACRILHNFSFCTFYLFLQCCIFHKQLQALKT